MEATQEVLADDAAHPRAARGVRAMGAGRGDRVGIVGAASGVVQVIDKHIVPKAPHRIGKFSVWMYRVHRFDTLPRFNRLSDGRMFTWLWFVLIVSAK